MAFPILRGVDFQRHFDLAVDIKNMKLTRNGHPYVQLSAPQSSGHVGVVADISTPSPAGAAQQPQAASLCARPPAGGQSQVLDILFIAVLFIAENPKQDRNRFNSITKTKHFVHLVILFI